MKFNLKQKSIFLATSILLSLMVFPTSAHAVFGLSKCEKFKKEITSYEKKWNGLANSLFAYKGQLLKGRAKTIYTQMEKSDILFQIWKSAYNNKSCLTNTQKDIIPTLKEYYIGTFVQIDTGIYTKNTAYCKKGLNFLDDKCRYTEDDKVKEVYIIRSIFDY